ncbi:hypothetical protein GWK08_16610 [Leptobacterium flavescens]|uniref:HTH LytTR-type domain-containing protein n=1 Tax=Leptobacterium flavescens TaxID=472055 RepID=A0A6P0USW7_9FLAO|nr:LytTR family DNA-binding domain-containing protein [Leptobacterium flavescens]NER15078.1 hypothetical protein [Leptobacterium flavescens]
MFLVFFLPFGIDNYNPNHEYTLAFLFEISKFGIAVFIFSVFNEFVLRSFFLRTVDRKGIILWSIWTLLLLSTVTFFLYNILGNWHDFSVQSYLGFLVNTSAVLIFPIIGTFFFFQYRLLQHKIEHILTTKEEFVGSGQLISFKGQGSKDQITLAASNFLYGKAQDNYVELHFLEQDQLKTFLIRSSLHSLVDSINSDAIKRCHRSYMINLLHVNAIKGSNQEMSLFLDPSNTVIPVSKSYKNSVLKTLRDLKNFG